MKQTEDKKYAELRRFDDSVSLWQMIPAGSGKALILLQNIVDHILYTQPHPMPSILITGIEGKKSHSRAFLRAIAIDRINEIPAFMLHPASGELNYFHQATRDSGYILADVDELNPDVLVNLHEILTQQRFSLFNMWKESKDTFGMEGVVILTTESVDQVHHSIRQAVDYHVEIEPYTNEQYKLIVLQRLKYCGIQYDCETVLDEIVSRGKGKLRDIIDLIRVCITLIQPDERTVLELKDVRKAVDLLSPPVRSKSL
jgi:hypothetical protein